MKIGVFDSGIGGGIVANALRKAFTEDEVLYVNDHKHVPYGNKGPEEIRRLTLEAIKPLVIAECQIIVIACNTATTNAINFLREKHPAIFFIGLEPMIKPAVANTKTKTIAVCATRATLASSAYTNLKSTWANDITIIEPDCHEWATLIEAGDADEIDVAAVIKELALRHCDVIVLGCTHYHWLKERLQSAGPSMTILEPTDAIQQRIRYFKRDYSAFTAATN